jgi:hypothetical protein
LVFFSYLNIRSLPPAYGAIPSVVPRPSLLFVGDRVVFFLEFDKFLNTFKSSYANTNAVDLRRGDFVATRTIWKTATKQT